MWLGLFGLLLMHVGFAATLPTSTAPNGTLTYNDTDTQYEYYGDPKKGCVYAGSHKEVPLYFNTAGMITPVAECPNLRKVGGCYRGCFPDRTSGYPQKPCPTVGPDGKKYNPTWLQDSLTFYCGLTCETHAHCPSAMKCLTLTSYFDEPPYFKACLYTDLPPPPPPPPSPLAPCYKCIEKRCHQYLHTGLHNHDCDTCVHNASVHKCHSQCKWAHTHSKPILTSVPCCKHGVDAHCPSH